MQFIVSNEKTVDINWELLLLNLNARLLTRNIGLLRIFDIHHYYLCILVEPYRLMQLTVIINMMLFK